jgi:hypothetical protein
VRINNPIVKKIAVLGLTGALISVVGMGCDLVEEKSVSRPETTNATSAATTAVVTVSFQKGVLPLSTYSGAADATVSEAAPSANNGAGDACTVSGASGTDLSCLMKMDVSRIPVGSIVQSANLKFYITNKSGVSYQVYPLKQGWSETAATWKNRTSTALWQTAGAKGANDRGTASWGNFIAPAVGSYSLSVNAAGVAGVQAWINNPAVNQGLIIANASNTDILAFSSKEAATSANRPKWTVTYLPPVLSKITANPIGMQPGRLHSQYLTVKLVNSNGAAVANAPVNWSVSAGGGWVYPLGPVTDVQGLASARWIAGSPPSQSITAKVGSGTSAVAATFNATAVSQASNANSVHMWFYPVGGASSAYSIVMTPKTAVNDVYYAAATWVDAYTGLQQLGDGSRKAIFSVWNIPEGDAKIIDASGSVCDAFGGEGQGVRCLVDYAWQPGKSYKFDISSVPGGIGRDYTVNITDVATGAKKKIATIRFASPALQEYYYSFVEDFGPAASNCLTTGARTLQLAPPSAFVNGAWQTIKAADFTHYYELDVRCANVIATAANGVFTLGTGGLQVGNPLLPNHLALP